MSDDVVIAQLDLFHPDRNPDPDEIWPIFSGKLRTDIDKSLANSDKVRTDSYFKANDTNLRWTKGL